MTIWTPVVEGEDTAQREAQAVGGKRARDLTLLGDILKGRNYLQAAILEYEKAIQESKGLSPVLVNKLAGAYMDGKQYQEAEKLLTTNLRYYPQFPTTLTNMGEIYFLKKNYQDAADYFQQAERINPFNPYVHLRLIRIYSALGWTDKKEQQEKWYRLIK